MLDWIQSFLDGRTQYVTVGAHRSNKINVTSGVPQGSVLGPTLFLYFINDMPDKVECGIKIFADDTKAYAEVDNSDESRVRVQNSIDRLAEWTDKWLLKFNSDKCKVLHLGKDNPLHEYFIGNGSERCKIDTSDVERDLGVMVDGGLSFETHINVTVKKASKISGLLVRSISNKSKEIMVPLFKTLVRPILEYANPVWCPFFKKTY